MGETHGTIVRNMSASADLGIGMWTVSGARFFSKGRHDLGASCAVGSLHGASF